MSRQAKQHARCGTKEVPQQASRRKSGNEWVNDPPYWLTTYIVVLIGGTKASPFLRAIVMVAIQFALLLGSSFGALAPNGSAFSHFHTTTLSDGRVIARGLPG